jgi:hypothetical protein
MFSAEAFAKSSMSFMPSSSSFDDVFSFMPSIVSSSSLTREGCSINLGLGTGIGAIG